jgi:hypothetical protein
LRLGREPQPETVDPQEQIVVAQRAEERQQERATILIPFGIFHAAYRTLAAPLEPPPDLAAPLRVGVRTDLAGRKDTAVVIDAGLKIVGPTSVFEHAAPRSRLVKGKKKREPAFRRWHRYWVSSIRPRSRAPR